MVKPSFPPPPDDSPLVEHEDNYHSKVADANKYLCCIVRLQMPTSIEYGI